jgi:hypothetical protein
MGRQRPGDYDRSQIQKLAHGDLYSELFARNVFEGVFDFCAVGNSITFINPIEVVPCYSPLFALPSPDGSRSKSKAGIKKCGVGEKLALIAQCFSECRSGKNADQFVTAQVSLNGNGA